MTSTSQVTASQLARAPEAATGGLASARGSARRASGAAEWPGGRATAAPGPASEAFTTVLARHRRDAAEARVRAARDKSADDAALDDEREAARSDVEALRAFAAPIDPALPAASERGIGVPSVGQGEPGHRRGVPGAAAPGPDSLEPASPATRGAASASGSSAGAEEPTVGSAIGPAILARAEAARAAVAGGGPPGSPSPARESAPDASAASRAVSAVLPATAAAGDVAAPTDPAEPGLGAAVSAAPPGRPGAADDGRPASDEAGRADSSSRPEQGAGRAGAGDPSLRVGVGSELGAAVSAALPRRPGTGLRAADDGRPAPDEAGRGELSSRPEQGAGRASAVDPVLRVAAAPGDRAHLRDELDGLGEGGSETGDGRGIAGAGPAQPAAAGEAKASRAEPGVSARSAAEQIAEEIANRLGLIRRPGRHEISLELRPDNLGTVHLAARIEGGRLTLELRAELAQSRDLLQQALPQLRELLVQQGIDAGRLTIHLGLDTAARDSSGQHSGAPRHFMRDEALPGEAAPDGAPVRRRQPGPGGFDFLI